MALRDDLAAALVNLGQRVKYPVPELDGDGECRLVIPVPEMLARLHDNEMLIHIRLENSDTAFSMLSPVAAIQKSPKAEFWETLLRQQAQGGKLAFLSTTIADMGEVDVIMATTHWITDSITPDQFYKLYQTYIKATLDLIDEVNHMAQQTSGIRRLHQGRN